MPSLSARRTTYYQLSTAFAHFDNDQLKTLLQAADSTHGRGMNHTITLGKSKVFVKSVPVTDLEYNHPFATRNLYGLPTYYNYGVGSAGFGVWREHVTLIKTTNWVLSGACEHFPLMYHSRMISRAREDSAVDREAHENYVTYWNSNANIGQFILDRQQAKYELVVFLEYFPYVLEAWWRDHLEQINPFIHEIGDTITFLRKNGIIHFDANSGNIVTDGEHPYLSDFGLALDKRFDLSENEQAFFKKHTHYDYGELFASLGLMLGDILEDLPKTKKKKLMQKYGIREDASWDERCVILLENIQIIHEDGLMKLKMPLMDTILKYQNISLLMLKFFDDMRQNPKKDTKFQNTKLKRLVEAANLIN